MALFTEENFKKVVDPGNLTGINSPGATPIPYQEENEVNARAFLARLAQYNAQYNQAYNDQNAAARYFQRVIRGQAPSVAGQQLTQGLDAIAQQQQSQVAGTSGVNAAAARREAMANTEAAQVDANRAAALARTQEINDAAKMEAAIRANQAGQAAGMFGTNVQGATGFGNLASGAAAKSADVAASERDADRAKQGNIYNAAGSAISLYAKSDERTKENVEPISGPEMEAFLKRLGSGKTFNYKPDEVDATAPAGDRVGVMAQDVKKGGPVGESIVVGKKPMMLDTQNGMGAALAAIGYLAKKVKELEVRR
jgi:hypothetical protein